MDTEYEVDATARTYELFINICISSIYLKASEFCCVYAINPASSALHFHILCMPACQCTVFTET